MKQEHRAFFDTIIKKHIETMKRDKYTKTKESVPVCYILERSGRLNVVLVVAPNNQSPMNALKHVVKQFNTEAYVFCAEAWMKQLDKSKTTKEEQKTAMQRMERYGVRNEPDKTEIFIAVCGTMSGHVHVDHYQIKRDKSKRIVDLVKNIKMSKMEMESRKIP